MKVKDWIMIILFVGLIFSLFFLHDKNKAHKVEINGIKEQQKENLHKIDSLIYKNDKLLEAQDSLEKLVKSDSILLEKKQKGINKLYKLLKNKNEEINNSSSTDDYDYLLNVSE